MAFDSSPIIVKECRCEGVSKEIHFLKVFGDSRLVCTTCYGRYS